MKRTQKMLWRSIALRLPLGPYYGLLRMGPGFHAHAHVVTFTLFGFECRTLLTTSLDRRTYFIVELFIQRLH